MRLHVVLQRCGVNKTFAAPVTLVGFEAHVNGLHVILERAAVNQHFGANVAHDL